MPDEDASELAAIWAEHRSGTVARLRALEAAAIAILEGTLTEELRLAARREAHTLAGSVGFFGFDEGSALARDLETRLDVGPPPADAPAIAELVEGLRRAIDRPAPARAAVTHRLLVIDPDAATTSRLGGAAARSGAAIVTAADLPSALQLIRPIGGGDIDAAIVSALMPDAERIIAGLVAQGVAVVAIGSGADAAARIAVGKAGAISFTDRTAAPETIVGDALRAAGESHALLGTRIVAVDDDPTVIRALEMFLGWYGARVIETDSNRLWDTLAASDPSLVLLDVEMPGVSGTDLCRALRADPVWRELPIVFLTGASDPAILRDLLGAGADDCITKPVGEAALALRLARVLQARARARPAAPGTGEGVEIVVVDDDPVIADILLRALAARGHRATWIEDGAAAAASLESWTGAPPKVVLLDIDLPGLDGYGVLRRATASDALRGTRFIVLTGRSSESETIRALELGAFDHVAKPFSIPVLMQRVRRALDT
ncbi:MAG: response regulator [Chloroflexota bacterium]